ncbi:MULTISPECIES: hypothetical protein [Photorhabdus]|uniref:hypothetical protein n=1 Tax=Photorhabdus TaxID=29487 RepID=UPI00059D5F22|nr:MULTISPECIES: hypothetical protein [Photorhabdus]AWK40223.1 hypothetical protein A4R40_01130 [Photorhabdus laumondii subsp. laumondii]MBS9428782.1 hypothetical protein [Photorhabdus akhurstii]RAW71057.1 hypothetical protein CKY15_09935 [Photorhabdus sp. S7-51]RAW77859.1 hypothetical protein CKY06_10030 [Photorhabdus sp. S15-56]RAW84959.1 hypothetical protein CKY12_11580 [Photorhabdus sp. S12-55]RAW85077.1 hypothetical protein CKY09_11320 [Photorhabdus sp. S5P8-50]
MKNKIFSKRWFKNLFYVFIKELLWSNMPVIAIFICGIVSVYFFPDEWWIASLIGSIVIVVLFLVLTYLSERKKS